VFEKTLLFSYAGGIFVYPLIDLLHGLSLQKHTSQGFVRGGIRTIGADGHGVFLLDT
jgi:hypothetical protein